MESTLHNVYTPGACRVSFEVYPPKTSEGDAALRDTLTAFRDQQPAFVSCTYGAGGSTSKRTLEWCAEIRNTFSRPAVAHLTCLDATSEDLLAWLELASRSGASGIMALRGDRPKTQTASAPAGGLQYAHELVSLIRRHRPELFIGVAGYPEMHPEATDSEADLRYLIEKIDAGADAVYTQLFYDNAPFFRFRDRLAAAGVTIPIVAGIMPITEYAQILRIAKLCRATLPPSLASRLEAAQHDPAGQFEIGVEHAIQQCEALVAEGISGLHFYILNKSAACLRILGALSLNHPKTGLAA